ncbi:MAG: hypothetical protein A2W99_03380 [Bacteroidetes bacterium GWF2_33_16]|nr:MAG: hypothetical protein A2X00_11690 [Bacteroidetes bacterium GWE2_32_14]OFY08229.1 MAG: hypothetical protein A2W99_03380 [Bacteroidetes bacterium GWF2_33_16]
MNLTNIQSLEINWDNVPITKYSGETGWAYSRTFETEHIRIRIIEYSQEYLADHWCCRGHIIHLLEGSVIIEIKDKHKIYLKKGMSLCLGDNESSAHRVISKTGCSVLIID